jgi:hypothetical protein
MADIERAKTLLKAAHELLMIAHNSPTVEDVMVKTVEYDGTECDGWCLGIDIENWLDSEGVPLKKRTFS